MSYEGELSDTGRGGGERRWIALYARAEVEFVDFDRICERLAVSRKEAGACDDARVVRVGVLRGRLVAMVLGWDGSAAYVCARLHYCWIVRPLIMVYS